MPTQLAILVIEAADRGRANQVALLLDPEGGARTFTAGLSANGEEPASHYWCATTVSAEVWGRLLTLWSEQFPSAKVVEWFTDFEPNRPARLLEELGLRTIDPQL